MIIKIINKKIPQYLIFLGTLLSIICIMAFYNISPKVKSIKISDNLNDNNTKSIHIELISNNNKDIFCMLTKPGIESGIWVKAIDKKCVLENDSDEYQIYIKYNKNKIKLISDDLKFEEVLHLNIVNTNKYLAVGSSFKIKYEMDVIGKPNQSIIFTSSNPDIAKIETDKVIGISPGKVTIKAVSIDGVESSIDIIVTNLIKNYILDNNKPIIPCNQYSKEESIILDDILLDIINIAGEKTRGAVIAVARFLPLQFEYKVPYFFENGRLQAFDGQRVVDGEGRYYHKGLYLYKDKTTALDQSKIGWGPAIWGCGLTNWDTSYGWKRGVKYPNGLDCSGFVSWVLYNAGFDVGDIGAGISTWTDLTSYGKLNEITYEYINAREYKVGDLIGRDGHIAIIAGLDEQNIYIAESLLSGVVIEKFSIIDENSKLYRLYNHVIDMEEYYNTTGKGDGNYSQMWTEI